MLIRLLFCLSLVTFAYCDCVLISLQDGPPGNASALNMTQPALYGPDWTGTDACPEFKYVNSCCTPYLNTLQAGNFQRLTSAFGFSGGGCDVCAANLMRFFCYYSCSPDQDKFMTLTGYENVTVIDDNNQLVTIPVAAVSVNVNADMACGIFESCTKISFMTEISAGSSALGFITFLFDRGTTTSNTKDTATVVNDGGLTFVTPPHRCNETFPNKTDEFNYSIPNPCPCNYCGDSCAPLELITYGNISDGFKASNVILSYMFAVLLTIGCVFLKGYRKNRQNKKVRQNMENSGLRDPLLDSGVVHNEVTRG